MAARGWWWLGASGSPVSLRRHVGISVSRFNHEPADSAFQGIPDDLCIWTSRPIEFYVFIDLFLDYFLEGGFLRQEVVHSPCL
ncbi:hypothetical protein NDU88_001692 [Pleurodeles waltl]|uniref:Uncharacterized protein n=1 Tax=Pleurodeles waltl TaxID=8319 RepID=A0AAV7Q4K7_PLEWA|nr:hypothetical protein NDU88_001692 [Pleurodeles waltl]